MSNRTTTVVEVGPAEPYDRRVRFLDRTVRLVRVTARDADEAVGLLGAWAGRARVLAVDPVLLSGRGRPEERLRAAAGRTPVVDGRGLAAVLQEWAVRQVQGQLPGYFANARTVVLGEGHDGAVRALRELTPNIEHHADPGPACRAARSVVPGVPGVPEALHLDPLLDAVGGLARWPFRTLPGLVRSPGQAPGALLASLLARRTARGCDVVVARPDQLAGFDLGDLAGKTVVTSSVSDEQVAGMAARGVDLVLDAVPQPFRGTVSAASLEALLVASADGDLDDDQLLEMIVRAGWRPRVLRPHGPRRTSRFAFVIHPLSTEFFAHVEPLGTLMKVAPPPVVDVMEKVIAYAPPFTYSHVTGIESPTGDRAEGWLITVGGTPKELLAHDPEFTYAKLLAAADIARRLGAQVMGLGAFTKVVGDAGVTVARRAPLPITTGNSYSASGALWAAHEALDRLDLVDRDERGRIRGKAMVVGATGAIGSVCARLLALASDELWLVSPETAKLLALKHEIEQENPRARVGLAATPDEHLPDMDVVVTATSGAGKRVLDIMAVKPGCVITDVARPLDLSAEDVAKRPDVMVVESGEIELPGQVRMRDIGLPPGVVYACLAETIVLALEGRYESFTVGRSIEWEKVKEIYRLGLKHGMRLATISGVNGVFTDADVARIRELARERRAALVPA